MESILETLTELDDHTRTFSVEPIPSLGDSLAMKSALQFLELDKNEQRETRALISDRLARFLLSVFSSRLAILAVRRKEPTILVASLALHAMEDFRFDVRENMRVFALVGDACGRVGVSIEEIWLRVKDAFSEEHQSFAERARRPDAPETMGMRGAVIEGAFDYVPVESKS